MNLWLGLLGALGLVVHQAVTNLGVFSSASNAKVRFLSLWQYYLILLVVAVGAFLFSACFSVSDLTQMMFPFDTSSPTIADGMRAFFLGVGFVVVVKKGGISETSGPRTETLSGSMKPLSVQGVWNAWRRS